MFLEFNFKWKFLLYDYVIYMTSVKDELQEIRLRIVYSFIFSVNESLNHAKHNHKQRTCGRTKVSFKEKS